MSEFMQAVTAIDSEDLAERLARGIVDLRLAACVQIVGPIRSLYWWQGSIDDAREWQLIIKTTSEHLAALERLGPTTLHRFSFEPVRIERLCHQSVFSQVQQMSLGIDGSRTRLRHHLAGFPWLIERAHTDRKVALLLPGVHEVTSIREKPGEDMVARFFALFQGRCERRRSTGSSNAENTMPAGAGCIGAGRRVAASGKDSELSAVFQKGTS